MDDDDENMKCHVTGCCSAKMGANLIGILYGVVAFYLLVLSAEYASDVFRLANNDEAVHFLGELGLTKIARYNFVGVKTLKVSTIAASLVNGITYVSSALLVIGVNNRDRRLLLPWIVYSILLLVAYVVAALITLAVTFAMQGVLGFAYAIAPVVAILMAWSFFIAVVNRHYSELSTTPRPGDIVRKNSAAQEDNGNTSTPQGVSYLHTFNTGPK